LLLTPKWRCKDDRESSISGGHSIGLTKINGSRRNVTVDKYGHREVSV